MQQSYVATRETNLAIFFFSLLQAEEESSSEEGLSVAVIVVITLMCLVVVIVVIGVTVWYCKSQQMKKNKGLFIFTFEPSKESRHGRVVRALECAAEGHRFRFRSGQTLENLIVHPAVNGYLILNGKVKDGKRRGLGPAFHMPCPRHSGALTPCCPNGHQWPLG